MSMIYSYIKNGFLPRFSHFDYIYICSHWFFLFLYPTMTRWALYSDIGVINTPFLLFRRIRRATYSAAAGSSRITVGITYPNIKALVSEVQKGKLETTGASSWLRIASLWRTAPHSAVSTTIPRCTVDFSSEYNEGWKGWEREWTGFKREGGCCAFAIKRAVQCS